MVKKGRPNERGRQKAERRLKRELADQEALGRLLETFRDIIVEFEHVAINNPVVGVALSFSTAGILHRFGVIDDFTFAAILASIGALEVGQIAGNLGNALSNNLSAVASVLHVSDTQSAASQENLISPNASNLATVRGSKEPLATTNAGGVETVRVEKP